MPENTMDLARLKDPFEPGDIEWRVGRAGKNDKGIWATCLAYITNRAIMERLDDVVGPGNWKNEYTTAPCGGVLCGLSVRIGDEWVTKWDGAENTDMEAVKGGLSGAMKRAAVQWGIGRYLYDLPEGWAIVNSNGAHRGKLPEKAGGDSFRWSPPALPGWALPKGSGKPAEVVDRRTGEILDEPEPPAEYVSEFQANEIRQRLTRTGSDVRKFLVHMSAESVEKILVGNYDKAIRALDAKAAQNGAPKAAAK